jgi:hypothetical protein
MNGPKAPIDRRISLLSTGYVNGRVPSGAKPPTREA